MPRPAYRRSAARLADKTRGRLHKVSGFFRASELYRISGMNSNRRLALRPVLIVGAVFLAAFAALRLLPPSPRFRIGLPETVREGPPVIRGEGGREVYLARRAEKIIAFEPTCGGSGEDREKAVWNDRTTKLECPAGGGAYDESGKSLVEGRPSLRRYRVVLAPNGEIEIDRSKYFEERDWIKPGADLTLQGHPVGNP